MNYSIIKDEKLLKEFIEWLPELKRHEMYYVSLLGRNKYCKDLKTSKAQLKRFTSNKEYLFDKIKQLEVEVGSYKFDKIAVPQESLALYISPNPRDLIKATKKSLKVLLDKVLEEYNGYNPHQIVMSSIQESSSKRRYMDFDYDNVDIDNLVVEIKKILNFDAVKILKTRGGCHVLVDIKKISPKHMNRWYENMASIQGCDINGDCMIPVVGCTQGEFVPHFIN